MKLITTTVFIIILAFPGTVFAYIGPGAGFVFISSFFTLLFSVLLSFLSLIFFPVRFVVTAIKRKTGNVTKTRTKKAIIVGFDGMDPNLTEKFLSEGLLPNFEKLKLTGSYAKLQTTNPPISPVAWSSFSTGTGPGKHNIFDFLRPDRKNYSPELSSVEVIESKKTLNIGRFSIPLEKPQIVSAKKSKTFWKILGDNGIFSTVIRVPLTYPAEKFFGCMLSGMCVPDLQGTQGTFTYYSTRRNETRNYTVGNNINIKVNDNTVHTYVPGPPNPFLRNKKQLKASLKIDITGEENVKITVGRKVFIADLNKYTDWIEIPFRIIPGIKISGIKISGIAKFYLKSIAPNFELYLSPVNIHPEKPVLPVSSPKVFSTYLSKLIGKFGTLGLAEDTWALNESVISENAFWDQTMCFHEERKRMFNNSLKKLRKGALICVFDMTDRIQHMFMRYLDQDYRPDEPVDNEFQVNAIKNTYILMDEIVGDVLKKIDSQTALIVLSDHGFTLFKKGFNLNQWLFKNGFLCLKDGGQTSGEWFENVDWDNTKAFGLGLAGLYINQKGRESHGFINSGDEKVELLKKLRDGLMNVLDELTGENVIREVHISSEVYDGPYKENAPDLIIGYRPGYRVSWNSVTGNVCGGIIETNDKCWSGDHVIDYRDVPGIILCNRKLESERPAIIDIAPSILRLFGIKPPGYIDGEPIIPDSV